MPDARGKIPPVVVIAAASSGSGKTVVSLGVMEALRRRGFKVQPFKAGPDYIDPGLHSALLGRPSYNLDTWMMGVPAVKKTFYGRSASADFSVIEGVMGLFDGMGGHGEVGSTAHLAKVLGAPVIFVVNAEKTARSASAVVAGFAGFDPRVDIRWVVFNRVGSARHSEILRDSIPKRSGVRVLGCIPADAGLELPHRHLGLKAAGDIRKAEWGAFIKRAGALVEEFMDMDGLIHDVQDVHGKRAGGARGNMRGPVLRARPHSSGVRIAVARDEAFSFYYEENLDILRRYGADIAYFSPIRDKTLPKGSTGIYIGGGYPELHAAALAANAGLREEIKRLSAGGIPVFAECGGLMYLGKAVRDLSGRSFPMAGVFPWTSTMGAARKALGYREVDVSTGCPMLRRGGRMRGHEFRYSEIRTPPQGVERVFRVADSAGLGSDEGYVRDNTLATYVHLHFASNAGFARGFVDRCREFIDNR
jgi:cobyrinic acid a,c-diamide synthase